MTASRRLRRPSSTRAASASRARIAGRVCSSPAAGTIRAAGFSIASLPIRSVSARVR